MAEQGKGVRPEKGTRLNRWSERKLEVQAEEREALQAARREPAEDAGAKPDDGMPDLPDIETLGKESDFTPFLDGRVPEELQRLALRKLWTSDPVFAAADGLNDYDPEHMTFLEQVSEAAQKVLTKAIHDEEAAEAQAAGEAEETPPEADPERQAASAEDASPDDAAPSDGTERAAAPTRSAAPDAPAAAGGTPADAAKADDT